MYNGNLKTKTWKRKFKVHILLGVITESKLCLWIPEKW